MCVVVVHVQPISRAPLGDSTFMSDMLVPSIPAAELGVGCGAGGGQWGVGAPQSPVAWSRVLVVGSAPRNRLEPRSQSGVPLTKAPCGPESRPTLTLPPHGQSAGLGRQVRPDIAGQGWGRRPDSALYVLGEGAKWGARTLQPLPSWGPC